MIRASINPLLIVLLLAGSTDFFGLSGGFCANPDDHPPLVPAEEECESSEETEPNKLRSWVEIVPAVGICRSPGLSVRLCIPVCEVLQRGAPSARAVRGPPVC